VARISSAEARRSLAAQVKRTAREAGFDLVGITTADDFVDAERVTIDRINKGLMGGLPWFHKDRVKRGCRPSDLLPGARSVIALGLSYRSDGPSITDNEVLRGRVSRYAWGRDYHRQMGQRAKTLVERLEALGQSKGRFYVDYGPLPDRAIAQRAGLGWYGKNTNILTSEAGSWVFLAEILTDLDLEPDEPLKKSCGSCTACIPACPTNAIPAPYTIDNTLCISYHTIENRGSIPSELRPRFGNWIFGCDICQDVCPVNEHNAAIEGDEAFATTEVDRAYPNLITLLTLTKEEFDVRYRGTPLMRAKHEGMQRNACVALGNIGHSAAIQALRKVLLDGSPIVREHAAWALGRIGGAKSEEALIVAYQSEEDEAVQAELQTALAQLARP